jgi:hypothetical protein
VPVRSDPAPIAHEPDSAEEVSLDHEAIEAPNALLRVHPVQHEMVPDRGSEVVRHLARLIVHSMLFVVMLAHQIPEVISLVP